MADEGSGTASGGTYTARRSVSKGPMKRRAAIRSKLSLLEKWLRAADDGGDDGEDEDWDIWRT